MMLYLIGRNWFHLDAHMGGWGASATADGESALINATNGDLRNFPVELMEHKFPIEFRRYGLIPDSGGPGKHRGGLGTIREIELRDDGAVLSLWFERWKTPAWGLFGGKAGARPQVMLHVPGEPEKTLLKVSQRPCPRASVTSARSGGGGGYGPAVQRDPQWVREDLIDGYVTCEGALRDYGVVFEPGGFQVDCDATGRQRSERINGKTVPM